jgi:hypothetical protein
MPLANICNTSRIKIGYVDGAEAFSLDWFAPRRGYH